MHALPRFDVVLAGGGLANSLIALRLRALHPRLSLCVIDGEPTLGGNHTWSFHDGDVTDAQRRWLQPMVAHEWPRHAVCFRGRGERWIGGGYASITSKRLHAHVAPRLEPTALRLQTPLVEVSPTQVRCADGTSIRARAVVDGRGFRITPHLRLRHQKFVGLELDLDAPHGLPGPIVMDAGVPQHDGYRFVYVLPLARQRVLIEDTYYADGPLLQPALLRERIFAYAAQRGWSVQRVVREETGVLPIALDGDIDAFWRERAGQPCSGLRAGLFHPTTGYSLPQAVRLADAIAEHFAAELADGRTPSAVLLAAHIARHARDVWRSQAFFRALNRMLFLAGRPEARHEVLAHFYRLPDRLVGRFYGERLSWADKLRIVSGKPPVPMHTAIRAVLGAAPVSAR
jgi:lycopene beta-cyclase